MILALALALTAVGCGGTWSTEDLLFRSAVPRRDELQTELKQAPASPAGVKQQGLVALGQRSEAYDGTNKASTDFNNMLFGLLSMFEKVLDTPPTQRAPDRRIWGPFRPQLGNPLEGLVTITRVRGDETVATDRFVYSLEVRKDRASPFVEFIGGWYDARKGGIRHGNGQLALHAKALRDAGMETGDLNWLDTMTMEYDTQSDPLTVGMTLDADQTQVWNDVSASYAYAKYSDKSGSIRFEIVKNATGGLFSADERLLVTSRWTPTGRGRAELEILAGDGVGHKQVECWDDQLNLVYLSKTWDGTVLGNVADCTP